MAAVSNAASCYRAWDQVMCGQNANRTLFRAVGVDSAIVQEGWGGLANVGTVFRKVRTLLTVGKVFRKAGGTLLTHTTTKTALLMSKKSGTALGKC